MGKLSPLAKLCLGLITLLALVNLIAVFGPELGFDALWYHLTLPKLFLLQHRWYYPGGLLYYSAMPRLAETLFIPLLQFFGTTGPKLLQYASGLITAYFLFQIAREFYDPDRSALGALLFYSTWLVGWQSGSAYVDLIRTMFETLALYFVIGDKYINLKITPPRSGKYSWGKNWKLKIPKEILSGISLGLALGVKWHALATVFIFGAFFSPIIIPVALITASPWFYLAWRFTDSPIYPLLQPFMATTQLAQVGPDFYSVVEIVKRILTSPIHLAFPLDDLLNPVIAPLFLLGVYFVIRSRSYRLKSVLILAVLGLITWQLTPPPSSRYLLPFLPAVIIVSLSALDLTATKKLAVFAICCSAIVLIWLRTYANSKYLPVVLGGLTTNQFLTNQSTRLPGTFVDSDGWVEQNIPHTAKVLVDWHNLYYFPLNFDHTTWADPEQHYDYLITSNRDPHAVDGKLIHTNQIGAQVFQL